MRFDQVNLPEAVVTAHAGDDLVLFVGAGASMGPPSNLPLFSRLTDDLVLEARGVRREGVGEDVVLGDLLDGGFPVHARAAAIIGNSASRPNRLHKAIAALATSAPSVRIVTTNFDAHLSKTLRAAKGRAQEYVGPALPLGDSFEGIVYLHGKLGGNDTDLVLTDKDFGAAYLSNAWAARFLERMFSRYTVLFVGYSHNDFLMRYLARGLTRSRDRFALVAEPAGTTWRSLGVVPITYPNDDGKHAALPRALGNWAAWQGMGWLDHGNRIHDLVSRPPSDVPEEEDYLSHSLTDGARAGVFCESAVGIAWLTWAEKQKPFTHLFDPTFIGNEVSSRLANWFVERFVASEDYTANALDALANGQGCLSPPLWFALARHLSRPNPRPSWLRPWVALLLRDIPPNYAPDLLPMVLTATDWDADYQSGLLLIERLTEPRISTRSTFSGMGTGWLSVDFPHDTYWLYEALEGPIRPRLVHLATPILAIVQRSVELADTLADLRGRRASGASVTSFARGRIGSVPAQPIADTLDFLVDLAREALAELANTDRGSWTARIAQWRSSHLPLLRRLAIDGVTSAPGLEPAEKLQWLLAQNVLFSRAESPEVSDLLDATLSATPLTVVDGLVDQVLAGRSHAPFVLDQVRDQLSLLAHIVRLRPDHAGASAAFDEVAKVKPELASWLTGLPAQVALPAPTLEDLRRLLIDRGAGAVVEAVANYEESINSWRPVHYDLAQTLGELVHEHAPRAAELALSFGRERPELVRGVLRGLVGAKLDEPGIEAVVVGLDKLDIGVFGYDLARLLSDSAANDKVGAAWMRSHGVRALADRLWANLHSAPIEAEARWLEIAINDSAGVLMQFWVRVISAEWRLAGQDWTGLSPDLAKHVLPLLEDTQRRGALAQVVATSELLFFSRADHAWAAQHVLPLLTFEDDEARAIRNWQGFLTWGRFDGELLRSGLLSLYISVFTHLAAFQEAELQQLAMHLAAVALTPEGLPEQWLPDFIVAASPELRVMWAGEVDVQLSRLGDASADEQWTRWLGGYWRDRVAGAPVSLSVDEASEMLGWTLHCGERRSEAIVLACAVPARFPRRGVLTRLVSGSVLTAQETAALTLHVLESTEPPSYEGYLLRDLVPQLRTESVPAAVIDEIVGHAIRLGNSDAATW